jgi:hypothetical protein
MRATGESGDTKSKGRRDQLKKIDEALNRGAMTIQEGGRVITRIRFPVDDIKKASALRCKVHEIDTTTKAPRTRTRPSPAPAFVGPPELLTEQMLASRWFCSRSRLQHWRSDGNGPGYLKIGGRILYPLADVREFEMAHRVK